MIEVNLAQGADSSANVTSVQQDLGDQTDYSIQAAFSSGASTGTLTLEGSLDNTNYATIDNTSKSVTAGGVHIYNVTDGSYRYVRLKFTRTAGAGTLDVKWLVKQPSNHY